jgi:uncharacterized SAM-binding protein YcdF (DUF218 family)
MFVFLKILLFLFRPVIWIFIISLIALFRKKPDEKIRLFKWAFFLLLFFSNPFIIRKITSLYEAAPKNSLTLQHYSTGIVLGGFVSYNLYEDSGYFNSASDRFIETSLLYKKGIIQKIIVAAGNGYIVKNNFKEAEFAKRRFMELGIPATDIYTDALSRNTIENAVNTKKIIDSLQLKPPYLLISSALHLRRAQVAFNKNHIPVTLFPCDYTAKPSGNNLLEDLILPSATALSDWNNLIKEIIGITIYKLS